MLARLGQTEAALASRQKAIALNPTDYFTSALVFAAAGYSDESLDQLELAIKHGFRNYIWMKVHTDLQGLNDQPRFQAIFARVLR